MELDVYKINGLLFPSRDALLTNGAEDLIDRGVAFAILLVGPSRCSLYHC